jgi:RNA polymerase sigma factor (sigma-70 family)
MTATPDPDVLTDAERRWLDQISTQWTAVQDAEQFVLRYGPAICRSCESLLPRCGEADDVLQELLVRVVEKGFPHVDARKGRFRDYLKVTVRNAVITHLRRGARLPVAIAEHDGNVFLVLEYVRGGSVADLIKAKGRLDWHTATRLTIEACHALDGGGLSSRSA